MTSPRPEQATSARLLVFVEDAVHRAIELTPK